MSKNTGIERRALLKGAAWSVPVVAAAAAMPLAAASGAAGNAVLNKYNPQVGSYGPSQLALNSVQVWYDPHAFAPAVAYQNTPPSVSVTWAVVLTTLDGTVVRTLVPERTDVLARSNNVSLSAQWSDIPPGTYLVVSQIRGVQFVPNPYQGQTFSAPTSSAATQVTVKSTW